MKRGFDTSNDHLPIPADWLSDPPETLVAGSGPYAAALAFILGTVSWPLDDFSARPQPALEGGFPRVLEKLKRAFLIVGDSTSAAEALQCHSCSPGPPRRRGRDRLSAYEAGRARLLGPGRTRPRHSDSGQSAPRRRQLRPNASREPGQGRARAVSPEWQHSCRSRHALRSILPACRSRG